jgi:hypothetical protein
MPRAWGALGGERRVKDVVRDNPEPPPGVLAGNTNHPVPESRWSVFRRDCEGLCVVGRGVAFRIAGLP